MAPRSSSSPPVAVPSADGGAPRRRRPALLLTIVASGFLLLDALLLGLAGWYGHRPVLLLLAGLCVAAVGGVVAVRRRYLSHLAEVADARAALKREAAALARTLRPPE
jgi:hypothetical protein